MCNGIIMHYIVTSVCICSPFAAAKNESSTLVSNRIDIHISPTFSLCNRFKRTWPFAWLTTYKGSWLHSSESQNPSGRVILLEWFTKINPRIHLWFFHAFDITTVRDDPLSRPYTRKNGWQMSGVLSSRCTHVTQSQDGCVTFRQLQGRLLFHTFSLSLMHKPTCRWMSQIV